MTPPGWTIEELAEKVPSLNLQIKVNKYNRELSPAGQGLPFQYWSLNLLRARDRLTHMSDFGKFNFTIDL